MSFHHISTISNRLGRPGRHRAGSATRRSIRLIGAGIVLTAALAATAAPGWREAEAARARLHAARIALLEREDRFSFDAAGDLARERALLNSALAALATDLPPPVRTGPRLEAYVSMIDDSPQPFWRYLPPSWSATNQAPLLVFLHGFDPGIDLARVPGFPLDMIPVANRAGACIAAPFGRANTDFQGIGEQDVVIVMEEMARRYGCDRQRVVLFGHSMGGMGAWCMGARMPQLFNAILIVSGRGDFYAWHKIAPDDMPPWQRRLVDAQFASGWVHQLTATPLLSFHGMLDDLVSFDQGRAIFDQLRPHNPRARFISIPNEGHFSIDTVIGNPFTHNWLNQVLTHSFAKSPASRVRPGETGSRLQDAFLRPFLFVGAGTNDTQDATLRLRRQADEWQRFAKGDPRQILETELTPERAALFNLFLFGEPEESPLVQRVLAAGGVSIRPDLFRIAGRDVPRSGHGLWFTGRNPFNTNRTAVVQCGLPWGEHLSDNHRYDRIPDVIAYGAEADFYGANLAVAAGFLDQAGRVIWSDPPVTAAILPKTPPQEALPEYETPTPERTPELPTPGSE